MGLLPLLAGEQLVVAVELALAEQAGREEEVVLLVFVDAEL